MNPLTTLRSLVAGALLFAIAIAALPSVDAIATRAQTASLIHEVKTYFAENGTEFNGFYVGEACKQFLDDEDLAELEAHAEFFTVYVPYTCAFISGDSNEYRVQAESTLEQVTGFYIIDSHGQSWDTLNNEQTEEETEVEQIEV